MKYIYPIFVHKIKNEQKTFLNFVGNGFFIDNYFITAGHIIINNQNQQDQSNPFIFIDGIEKELTQKESLVCIDLPHDEKGNTYGYESKNNGDIAIFEFPGVESPLTLAESLPMSDEKLISSFFHIVEPHNCVSSKQIGNITVYLWETEGIVFGEDGFKGNFYGTTMNVNHPIDGGSSGSPLIKDNVVYGILHGGNPYDEDENRWHPEICVFYSVHSVIQYDSKYNDKN